MQLSSVKGMHDIAGVGCREWVKGQLRGYASESKQLYSVWMCLSMESNVAKRIVISSVNWMPESPMIFVYRICSGLWCEGTVSELRSTLPIVLLFHSFILRRECMCGEISNRDKWASEETASVYLLSNWIKRRKKVKSLVRSAVSYVCDLIAS